MLYHAIHKPVWRNGIRACLKNKSPYGVEGSNLSTGTRSRSTRFTPTIHHQFRACFYERSISSISREVNPMSRIDPFRVLPHLLVFLCLLWIYEADERE